MLKTKNTKYEIMNLKEAEKKDPPVRTIIKETAMKFLIIDL